MGDDAHEADTDRWTDADDERRQYEPWFAAYAPEQEPAQAERLADLSMRPGYDLHPRCYIAADAHVVAERLTVGAYSTIAAGCIVRGDVTIGEHTSLNSGAVTMGKVTIGSFVRTASYAVIVGENHGFDDLDVQIAAQPMTTEGVIIEDDVWIGANTTIVDGVTVGSHSVIAAGAVVTKDVPPWSVVAGVPARVIRDRRDLRPGGPAGDVATSGRRSSGPRRRDALSRFDAAVAEQWPTVLARCQVEHEGVTTYVDVPGAPWGPRPLNDAVEIAGAFGATPAAAPAAELVARVQALQDPVTGLFPDPTAAPTDDPLAFDADREWDLYGLLSCGYALEVLGAAPLHPVHVIEACAPDELARRLDTLDWGLLAWPAGSWIDGFATGAYLNRRHHGSRADHAVLWGWLTTHVDRATGMWGRHLEPMGGWDFRWLMAVNGYYRLTRGTYAQFGVPLPHPEQAIDTVLAHAADWDLFTQGERNACNVLDVVHPLWLLGRQTDHRRHEIRDAAARIIDGVILDWVDGQGIAWDVHRDQPGLQGTEMWLSVAYLAATILGEADGLSWEPRGVHRLAAATTLGPTA